MTEISNKKAVILNVDDDEAGRFASSAMLRAAGFEVWEAATGAEALRLVERRPDLVLLDIRLPDISGLEICQRIKANDRTASIMVVHVTATLVTAEDRAAGLELGADGYLTEPLTQAELLANVRAFLRIREAENTQRFLAEASKLLGATFEVESSLAKFAHLAVPFLADWCVIHTLDEDGTIRQIALAHADREWERRASGLARRLPAQPELPHGVAHAIRTRNAELHPDPAATWTGEVVGDDHPPFLRELGAKSYLCIPLLSRDRVLGAFTLALSQSKRRYRAKDLALAEELAQRVAMAMDNAHLYQEAQRASQMRENLLAVVSHDLKNPLGAIFMSVSLLLKHFYQHGDQHQMIRHLTTIQRASEKMSHLIRDLLDLASLSASYLPMARKPELVPPLVDEAAEILQPLAVEKSIELTVCNETDPVTIDCDRERLAQVLSNLLGNAIKFTPEGGTVQIRMRSDDSFVEFAVSDTGPGIRKTELNHLFERFWQASRERATGRGSGLGLSIAKGIVEAHGGRIWAESRLGAGSTFYFTVPRSNAARHDEANPRTPSTEQGL